LTVPDGLKAAIVAAAAHGEVPFLPLFSMPRDMSLLIASPFYVHNRRLQQSAELLARLLAVNPVHAKAICGGTGTSNSNSNSSTTGGGVLTSAAAGVPGGPTAGADLPLAALLFRYLSAAAPSPAPAGAGSSGPHTPVSGLGSSSGSVYLRGFKCTDVEPYPFASYPLALLALLEVDHTAIVAPEEQATAPGSTGAAGDGAGDGVSVAAAVAAAARRALASPSPSAVTLVYDVVACCLDGLLRYHEEGVRLGGEGAVSMYVYASF
jgi:hypothetical protein